MVTIKEKIGYGLGDTASNFIFQLIVNFLAIYYTDAYGLSPAVVGTLFLAVRLMDAVTDPVMGAICDRLKTRWGRFRPWMLWLAVPFGASTVIAFSVPEDSNILYAYVTYAVLMLLYTAVNIPYCALGGVITADPQERVTIQSWRFSFAMIGNIAVSSATLPMRDYFGKIPGCVVSETTDCINKAAGYQGAAAVFAVIAILLFVLCFVWTKERVVAESRGEDASVFNDLSALWKNDQWRLLALMNLVLLIAVVMRGTMATYYVEYVLEESSTVLTALLTLGSIAAVIGSMVAGQVSQTVRLVAYATIGGVQILLLAFFYVLGLIGTDLFLVAIAAGIVGTAVSLLIGRYFNKVRSFTLVFVLYGLAHFALFYVGGSSISATFFFFSLVMFLNQVGVPILWSMMADTVDYGTWKTGDTITGMNFSANLFALKIGVAIGGAGAGYILEIFGYVANQVQTADAKFGIGLGFAVVPGVCGLLIALISRWYSLDEDRVRQIQAELGTSDHGPVKTRVTEVPIET